MNDKLEDLINLLDIERIEVNLFRGESPSDRWQEFLVAKLLDKL